MANAASPLQQACVYVNLTVCCTRRAQRKSSIAIKSCCETHSQGKLMGRLITCESLCPNLHSTSGGSNCNRHRTTAQAEAKQHQWQWKLERERSRATRTSMASVGPLMQVSLSSLVQTESLRCAVKTPRRRMSGSITSKLPKLSLMRCGQVWVLAGWTRW